MANTLGYHVVKSAYGLWLPGDDRGHWSEGWDAQIGYYEPHTLHEGDPVRKRMAAERMKHPPVKFDLPWRMQSGNARVNPRGKSWRHRLRRRTRI